MMTKWEYDEIVVQHIPGHGLLDKLNVAGSYGWEVIWTEYRLGHIHVLLKRPKE